VELFLTSEDPFEQDDRGASLPQVVDDMRRRREWFMATYPSPGDAEVVTITPGIAEQEQLRALGYLGDLGDG
jgi:hypothetical protein